MTVARSYHCSDMKLLVVCATITESFLANREPIVTVQSSWADPFGENLKARIQAAGTSYIGKDYYAGLRSATDDLKIIQKEALENLGLFKAQLEVNFDNVRYKELLGHFGFANYYSKAQKGNQEALISLLMQIRQNLSEELKTELVAKGIAGTLPEALTSAAASLNDANIKQEALKSGITGNSVEAVTEFNAIHKQVMAICKIARRVFRDQPELQSAFSFSRVLKSLGK